MAKNHRQITGLSYAQMSAPNVNVLAKQAASATGRRFLSMALVSTLTTNDDVALGQFITEHVDNKPGQVVLKIGAANALETMLSTTLEVTEARRGAPTDRQLPTLFSALPAAHVGAAIRNLGGWVAIAGAAEIIAHREKGGERAGKDLSDTEKVIICTAMSAVGVLISQPFDKMVTKAAIGEQGKVPPLGVAMRDCLNGVLKNPRVALAGSGARMAVFGCLTYANLLAKEAMEQGRKAIKQVNEDAEQRGENAGLHDEMDSCVDKIHVAANSEVFFGVSSLTNRAHKEQSTPKASLSEGPPPPPPPPEEKKTASGLSRIFGGGRKAKDKAPKVAPKGSENVQGTPPPPEDSPPRSPRSTPNRPPLRPPGQSK